MDILWSARLRYFSLDAADLPTRDPIIVLDPSGGASADAPLNNVCFLSNCQPSYAPPGRALCSATIVDSVCVGLGCGCVDRDDATVAASARRHLAALFPDSDVASWTYERSYRIAHAQPAQRPDARPSLEADPVYSDSERTFVCGDHLTDPSLDGAMRSGLRAADACLESLGV